MSKEFRPSWAAWFWLLVISFGMAVPYVWWRRRGVRYELTENRIIKHTGRLSSKTDEFDLSTISRVKTKQALGEKFFGVGTITVDSGVDELTLKAVPNYSDIADRLRRAQTN